MGNLEFIRYLLGYGAARAATSDFGWAGASAAPVPLNERNHLRETEPMSGRNVLNGAQVIVDYLIQEKVPYAFGLCGHGNIQFIDALYERSDDIKTISVHHESVAGFMADAYYRVSGKPLATFTSCGPGSANLPVSLATAYLELGAVPGGDRQRADQPV